MKCLSLLLPFFSAVLYAQTVTYTPGAAPQSAVPSKLVATAGTGPAAVSCILTGDSFPATRITIACQVGTVTITSYTIPFSPGMAYTLQHNLNANAVTVIVQQPTSGPITVSATANGGTPTQGVF